MICSDGRCKEWRNACAALVDILFLTTAEKKNSGSKKFN